MSYRASTAQESRVATPAEAAYLADLSERDVSRIIDEDILPEELYEEQDGRRYWPLACVLARFYFETANDYSKTHRVKLIRRLVENIHERHRDNWAEYLALRAQIDRTEWKLVEKFATYDLSEFFFFVQSRARSVEKAHELIVSDPEIMGGEPIFKGTRIPVQTILACINAGIPDDEIFQSYPSLKGKKGALSAAKVWAKVRPKRGRPRKLGDNNAAWVVKSQKTLPSVPKRE